jgi:2-phosphoglycerate kinase
MPEVHRPVSDLVEESFAGFERQSEAIASAAAAVVAGFVEDGRSVVVERVITIAEENEHGEHVVDEAVHDLERLNTIRSIQLHLVARAHQAGVTCLDDRDTADLTQDVVDNIVAAMGT